GVPTGITAANVASLERQQVAIDGTVDASAIYLHGARVQGRTVDVFFVTTTYGKTLAIDAAGGTVLWEYTPPDYNTWVRSYRVTTATPVADPDRAFVYAASPDGKVQKLAVADGHAVWSTAITRLPRREKLASPLNYFAGHVIATTGGYIGDASPYQGHVAVLDAASGKLLHVWNSLCSGVTGSGELLRERLRHLGPRRGSDRLDHREHLRRDRQCALGRTQRLGGRRARARLERRPAARQLHAGQHRGARGERRGLGLDVACSARRQPDRPGREGRIDQAARLAPDERDRAASRRGAPGHPIGRGSLHGARGAANRDGDVALRRRQRRHRGLDARRRRAAPAMAQRELRHEPRR